MTVVIGLTGSIGTGKSMIANKMIELGIPIVDADIIAREVVEPGKEAHQKIVETFGEGILHEDKTLNRPALGEIVFSDEAKRGQLNEIIHPAIRTEMLKQRDAYVAENVPALVMDIPLLFESKLTHYVEKIIVVYVSEETQLERVMARDESTEEAALQRINSQIPVKEKAEQADAVIDNNGTREASYEQLFEILQDWGIDLGK
ncbi:MAG TPA: dephospho-CoA kinase [Pseudogracilibacillus sp.]|nr:dephospho-CoA kinase [Pseudogracilibacillus sp.]